MKRETKLVREELRQQETHAQQASETVREFATVEDLLRHDAAQTQVPPVIERRLAESTKNAPPPSRSWWRRLLEG